MAKLTIDFCDKYDRRVKIIEKDGTIRTGILCEFCYADDNDDYLHGICFRDDNGSGLYLTENDIEDIELI